MDIRKEFPFFSNRNVAYLDSAATTQKPRVVLETLKHFYETTCVNVHRGAYQLAEEGTNAFESSRQKIADFIGAHKEEIIFSRNATEAINLVAQSWGVNISQGDTILLTEMEHHSNIVPWQILAKKTGANIRYVPITESGELDKNALLYELKQKPKLFALTHISNVLGTINPIKEIISKAHEYGTLVLIDGAQSTAHIPVDVTELDCDFFVFSGHKMFAPFGIGVLYAKQEILDEMQPVLGGGEMIKEVSFNKSTFKDSPAKFEAGTPNVAGAISLAEAVNFIEKIGLDQIAAHEARLTQYALSKLKKDPLVKVYGPGSGVISFNLGDMHAHDVSSVLDSYGVCARSGHHCAQPLMERLGVPATVRISFSIYNNKEDVDRFFEALEKAKSVFKL